MFLPELQVPIHHFSRRSIDFSRTIAVMAVINRTPDSFYDAGSTFGLDDAVSSAMRAVQAGADWIDIGGVPFSPGPELPWEEEAARVVPVIEAVRKQSDVVISADTFLPEVAQAAINAGADVINDTTGLAYPEMAQIVARNNVHLVLTHSLAKPRTVYPRPQYQNVVTEVRDYLAQKVQLALDSGIHASKIIIDPGHDLNKNTRHTLDLTANFEAIAALGYPALAAVSNKDFIGETLDLPKPERLVGSMVAATMCVMGGARIIRMHNIAESVQTVRLIEAAQGWRDPAYQIHNMGEVNPPAHPEREASR
ncbi:dihydropteroate synthase [Arthrobacter sp. MYb211]|uniref:dihydropteroate synthase n=1 Tax=unclassified Arthrobacter TaxID=235627 RepID=UPI000CFC4315|nr:MULTISPECIES: dihydropteroate synthase [unclassified Arthrobacter]PRA06294.1 dihydropteroate synthase [Arthrobacter sp. MYb229]PRA12770.1 dihydropteroate synthase [Arthrobacter sp. MYb221]PRB53196.1 dihydropteroate synthase [Arthrobacter sp. MYb216]PRC09710.1 dihydropteroate synthase [Arthrobacter sp. MYb211]